MPDEGIGCGFTEAVRGVLSHHMVIKGGKIANYHPYPPTPWNANPRDIYGTPGPYEDAVIDTPIFEENDQEHFKGIDIMRTVRSFDPCLPCGVHMYLGERQGLEEAPLTDPGRRPGPGRMSTAAGPAEAGPATPGRAAARRTSGPPVTGSSSSSTSWRRRATARRAVLPRSSCGSVTDLYGAGLARVVDLAAARDPELVAAFVADELVASLLVAHGLHPETVERRVEGALASVRPLLAAHGGDVELLAVEGDPGHRPAPAPREL